MMLDQTLLGKTPEPFEAVDVDFAAGIDLVAVVDLEMTVAAAHQGIIDMKLVRSDDAAPANLLHRHAYQCIGLDVGNNLYVDESVPFQDAKHGNLSCSSAATFTFAPAAEVGFVELDFTAQERFCIGCVSEDGGTNNHDRSVSDLVRNRHLLGYLPCGKLQLEELDDPEPLVAGKVDKIEPPSREVVERVPAAGAATPTVSQLVKFPLSADGTKSLLVFPAKSQQVFSCGGLATN